MKYIKTNRPFSPRRYDFNYGDLYEFRHVRRLTMPQIARKYGCNHTTVINAMVRLGIPTKLPLVGPTQSVGKGWAKEIGV